MTVHMSLTTEWAAANQHRTILALESTSSGHRPCDQTDRTHRRWIGHSSGIINKHLGISGQIVIWYLSVSHRIMMISPLFRRTIPRSQSYSTLEKKLTALICLEHNNCFVKLVGDISSEIHSSTMFSQFDTRHLVYHCLSKFMIALSAKCQRTKSRSTCLFARYFFCSTKLLDQCIQVDFLQAHSVWRAYQV